MPDNAVIVRETLGGQELARQTETTSVAQAAQARAEVETAIVMARRHPRDEDTFRLKFIKSCADPSFAELALYNRPVGRERDENGNWRDKYITGWSIRGVENAIQKYGNVRTSSQLIYEDDSQTQMRVTVMDLENVIIHSSDAIIKKTVERKGDIKKDRDYISSRQNVSGETIHRYAATDEEVRNKLGAERSKLLRDNGLRILPRHIMDEARMVVDSVLANEAAKDPEAAKKKVIDKFATIGVTPDMLKAYLERSLDGLTPRDVAELGTIFNGLKDGAFTWPDVMKTRTAPEDAQPVVGKSKEKLKDKIARAREAAASKPEEKTEDKQES